jgi:membrane-bound ClpP family serine protease
MATTGRMTITFSDETRRLIDHLIPLGRRTEFVERAVREALRQLEQDKLEQDMAELARESYDEMLQMEAEFRPLEEELHWKV